jgi:ketosteroid isomerase-like protein
MRSHWIAGFALLLLPSFLDAQAPRLDSAAARGVAQLLARFDETGSGRGASLAEQRAALFSDNAVMVNAFGVRVEGRDSLLAFWRLVYTSGSFASSTIERLDRQQRVLAPDLVLIDHVERITGQRVPDSGLELPPRTAHITLLLRRQEAGDWRIVYYRAGDVRDWPSS